MGYAYVHSAVDDFSRLAYSEVLPDEKGPTCAAFWRRARDFYLAHVVVVERVITDNAFAYRGEKFNEALDETRVQHRYCRPYRPQTNGKVCEHDGGAARSRSDPGQGMTKVSFVRFVDRLPCCVTARAGQTELT